MNVRLPGPKELFGQGEGGLALMGLERAGHTSQQGANHDIVLYKCYRNPREILVCAHALGFGIYSDTMVQTLENKDHWEDLGYEVEKGDFRIGSEIVVSRPEANSPLAISRRQPTTEIIKTYIARDIDQEVA